MYKNTETFLFQGKKVLKCLSRCKRRKIKCLISVSRGRYIITLKLHCCRSCPLQRHGREFVFRSCGPAAWFPPPAVGFSASRDIWYCRRAKIFQPGPGLWIYRQTFYHVAVKAGFCHNAVEVYYIHRPMTSGPTENFKIFCIWNLRLHKIISIILSWSNL